MPKIPETLLDKFAKLYHDRNVARKNFARIDKLKFQGVDMDKHRKWKAAADELIDIEDRMLREKVDQYWNAGIRLDRYSVNPAVRKEILKWRKDWHDPGAFYQGPRPHDIEYVDEKGIKHDPVYDPFHMVSPYYRRQLTDREYADLTNGL